MQFIVHEIRLFFIAIWFLSRLPIPKWVGFQEEWLDTSIKYSPFVGWILGSLGFIVFFIFQILFGTLVAFILSLGFLIIITGCFHEDGFSDFCDGIGGGWKREDILRIMKDSRVGSFGAAGLSLLLILKVAAAFQSLKPMDSIFGIHSFSEEGKNIISIFEDNLVTLVKVWLLFVVAHSLSRFISLSFMITHNYAKEEGYSKPMAKNLTKGEFIFSAIGGFLPLGILIYISPLFSLLLLPALLIRNYFSSLMKQWIGGFTGDCLGAVQQSIETLIWIWGIFLWISI
ncbi:adenosylcobinamide-GDP ribazoletransferase [Leptospira idonii]|uniref:Adenosylcobinamide-GDP ribazoletransferase n=1 Tax=Leptospira idonii TaxID=1193500 RepID=A0A4R9M2Q8_9LEPT|nr:adenosylcobinamide-GDP ribazoletransferase [Leptospira idonii]